MVDLTRRTFLAEAGIAGTLAATGLEAFLLGGCAFPTNTRQEKISFQGALANHHLRQAYLEQLVNSPYIDKVVYDHDKSKAIEMGTNPDDIEGAYASLSTTHYISSNGQRSNTFGMERKHQLRQNQQKSAYFQY
ncbi:twin-arginine translocation signal domain-containing protein [Candidatus Woesearchaeota archaeon]|nr:twin-arginine translocation signal domain-containing protein [Candidatus Woesearchaeota archaeon]